MKQDSVDFEFTSPKKIIYKNENITKLDVANYYSDVASRMLPFISGRLLSVIRCHDGVEGECFFKKHPTTETAHVNVCRLGKDEYFYIQDKAQLLYQIQMGTIEFHTWGSKVKNIDRPDLLTFDLDPSESLPLKKLRQGVLDLKHILEDIGLNTFLKTSGGKGYHVVVRSHFKDWESYNSFAKNVALYMESKWPNLYTSNIRKSERKDRIFIDYLRNARGATCVAPYSLRARAGAPISLPISWDNLGDIKPNDVTIKNYHEFLKRKDPWLEFYEASEKI